MNGPERLGVIGVLARGDQYLLVERADGLTNAGAWCFPGGHLEAGETSREAVVRELREELDIDVEPVVLLGAVHVESPRYRLDAWTVRLVGRKIRAQKAEVAAARFFTVEGIRAIPKLLPSTEQVLALLKGD